MHRNRPCGLNTVVVLFAIGAAVSTRGAAGASETATQPAADRPPNILVILVDDLGYADLSCQGAKDFATPRIDSLAANGIRCSDGYISAPQCSPSRAGLITGRYQNRFGHEYNAGPSDHGWGLSTAERTIADRLKEAGYATGIVGKWHLGADERFCPYNRGFQESFWHPGGGVYFPDPRTGSMGLRRGQEPVQESEYSTDAFGREAVAFIERHRNEPFFLYLAFITPHWPMEAKPEHLKQFEHVKDLHRRTFLAMMASLDENVGRVLDKLRETRLDERTMIFFISDNGGPTGSPRSAPDAPFQYGQNTSSNKPLRGVKGDLLEGGIRVPFLVQWKGHLPAGRVYREPVISLDVLPTALAAAGAPIRPEWKLDGTNLLPFLKGDRTDSPHETLYWRFNFPPTQPDRYRRAIRRGDWKLVKNNLEPLALYNLAEDIGETNNLIDRHPERAKELENAYRKWDAELAPPAWEGGQRPRKQPAARANPKTGKNRANPARPTSSPGQ